MNRVAILTNYGLGLYKFRREIIEELVKAYEVYLSLPADEYVPRLIKMGCTYIETPISRRGVSPVEDLFLLLKYICIIRDLKPNLVLTYTVKPNIYGGIACRLFKVPYMANITGVGSSLKEEDLLQKIVLQLYRIGLKKAACLFFQNTANRDYFRKTGLISTGTRLIPGSGVNLDYYGSKKYPAYDQGIRFLYIGRIMKEKGIEEFLAAVAEVKAIYPLVTFDLVGILEEDYSKKIEQLVRKGLINFYGKQDDVRPYLEKCHALVLPSYHEGISNVLLEAASSGRPVLASRVTGCRETLDEGVSGFCFEARNVDSLVQTIIKFIELPHERKEKMGLAGREKMEKEFDRNIVIDAYLDEIEKRVNK